MKEKYIIKKEGIFLFKVSRKNKDHCQLKDFINFLNFMKVKRPIKFAYVDTNATLLKDLTLKENIFLESIPNSLANSKEFQLKEFFKKKDNKHLAKLFERIDNLDSLSSEASAEIKKLTSIIKGFIQDVDYLFFESPERHLSNENLKIFIRALKYHIHGQNKIALINSPVEELWLPFCSSKVVCNQKKEFLVLPCKKNNFKSLMNSEISIDLKGKQKAA